MGYEVQSGLLIPTFRVFPSDDYPCHNVTVRVPLLSQKVGGERGALPRRLQPASVARTMAFLAKPGLLETCFLRTSPFQGHAPHPGERPLVLSPNGSALPCIREGVFHSFHHCAFTAHTSAVIATLPLSRTWKRERRGRWKASTPRPCSVRLRHGYHASICKPSTS
jgi:hypothetical protein